MYTAQSIATQFIVTFCINRRKYKPISFQITGDFLLYLSYKENLDNLKSRYTRSCNQNTESIHCKTKSRKSTKKHFTN